MITESDVRTALAEQARDVSEPDEILAQLQLRQPEHHQRQRWLAPLAAAAAVVAAVTVAGFIAVDRHHAPTGSGPAIGGRDLRYTVSVGAVAGYNTSVRSLEATTETTSVVRGSSPGGVLDGVVVAYSVGAYDPTEVKTGQQLTIQGRQAYYAKTPKLSPDPLKDLEPTLAWVFAPARWLVIQGWGPSIARTQHLDPLTEAKRVAAAVDTNVSEPLLLPFRVGYLPSGLQRGGGYTDPLAEPVILGDVLFTRSEHSVVVQSAEFMLYPKRANDRVRPNLTVNGHPAHFEGPGPIYPPVTHPTNGVRDMAPAGLTVDFGSTILTLTVFGGDDSKAQLAKIGKSIQLASDLTDQSTWFDANQ
jgi:hypothetical protein